jgi:hypothetical protein
MKRAFLAAFLVIGMTTPSTSPANAIFGLGACEKVSKQVLALEKIVTDLFTKSLGTNYEQVAFKKKETLWEPTSDTVRMVKKVIANDPVLQIWKIATNNPKCFTNTQNMQIVMMKDQSIMTYIYYPASKRKYKNTGECKVLMETTEREYYKFFPTKKTVAIDSKCAIKNITTINFDREYQSIYSY